MRWEVTRHEDRLGSLSDTQTAGLPPRVPLRPDRSRFCEHKPKRCFCVRARHGGAVRSAWALAPGAQRRGRPCAFACVETTSGYRTAARNSAREHILGQVLLKQGLLFPDRLDVCRRLLEPNQGEGSFWRRSPALQTEGKSFKFPLCAWRWVQEFINDLKNTLLQVIQGLREAAFFPSEFELSKPSLLSQI